MKTKTILIILVASLVIGALSSRPEHKTTSIVQRVAENAQVTPAKLQVNITGMSNTYDIDLTDSGDYLKFKYNTSSKNNPVLLDSTNDVTLDLTNGIIYRAFTNKGQPLDTDQRKFSYTVTRNDSQYQNITFTVNEDFSNGEVDKDVVLLKGGYIIKYHSDVRTGTDGEIDPHQS